MKTVIIDGVNIIDISSFYNEVNRVFTQGEDWKIGESLDAFDDLLYGGFGILKSDRVENADAKATDVLQSASFELRWHDITIAQKNLGVECTKDFYRSKLRQPSVYNKKFAEKKLEELENGHGQTYFEILIEIIESHKNIRFVKG